MATTDGKALLVREILAVKALFAACPHRRRPARAAAAATSAAFVDWYLILRINPESSKDVIRRRYRQLALQLHPDKNKHPKADVAFKLIGEAYSCLLDDTRRRSFDAARQASFCHECHQKHLTECKSAERKDDATGISAVPKPARPRRLFHALQEVQNRLKDECDVIETCLRANTNHRRHTKESPVFNPSGCAQYVDSPHNQNRILDNQRDFWYYQHAFGTPNERRWSYCESPIYQIRLQSGWPRTSSQI